MVENENENEELHNNSIELANFENDNDLNN